VRSREGGRVVVLDVQGATMPERGAGVEGRASLVSRATTSTTALGVRAILQDVGGEALGLLALLPLGHSLALPFRPLRRA
jgi:hypothetical protein